MKEGVTVDELIKSNWFENELTAEQRYQVEDGTLLARYKVEQEDKGLVASHGDEFDKLVAKYEKKAVIIEGLLEELASLAGKDDRYKEEIENQVAAFREGWSVVERDPSEDEVKGTIQYWKDVFGGEEE